MLFPSCPAPGCNARYCGSGTPEEPAWRESRPNRDVASQTSPTRQSDRPLMPWKEFADSPKVPEFPLVPEFFPLPGEWALQKDETEKPGSQDPEPLKARSQPVTNCWRLVATGSRQHRDILQ